MQIDITCNTEDEVLFRNIYSNSRLNIEWITEISEHENHAVIVGGGASLIDSIETIKWRQSLGQKIFALNGAARFLGENGIYADYQIILDARKENVNLVTGHAKEHLFASQCDPSLFEIYKIAPVKLWHAKIDDIENYLPDQRESLTLIGGGTTVGLSALCLAYTMGYRKLHLFGYDSSHQDGKGHAYSQSMNEHDQICKVSVFGKTFKSSLAMAKQAELFPKVCDNLIDLGCVITVDGEGLLPFMTREIAKRPVMTEQEKYQAMWAFPEYRTVAPGEYVAEDFVKISGVKDNDIVIDFGCGTGRGAKRIHDLTHCEFILTDFTDNSIDKNLPNDWYTFYRHDLTVPLNIKSTYGFCTDVMEHIPPDKVDLVIQNILNASERVFFQISLVDDVCGALIGQQLHLSVHPFTWWIEKFKTLGYHVEWTQDQGNSACFYIQLLGA